MTEPQDVLAEALREFFEDIDADWSNDNLRPGDFAFRFRAAADRLRAALVRTPETLDVERLRDERDELERLRRIELAAARVIDAKRTVRATSENFAEEPKSADAKTFWLMARAELDDAHKALAGALR